MQHNRIRRAVLASALAAVSLLGGVTAAGAQSADPGPLVVGGHEATKDVSFIGSLQYAGTGKQRCGLTLATRELAFTAAHCVDNPPAADASAESAHPARASLMRWASQNNDSAAAIDWRDPANYQVRIGSRDRTTGGTLTTIRKIEVYEGWAWGIPNDKGETGDMAALYLRTPVNLAPALLWGPTPNDLIRVQGWGRTAWDDPTTTPTIMRYSDTTMADPIACAEAGVGVGEYCLNPAEGGGTGCHGDSGTGVTQERAIGRNRVTFLVGQVRGAGSSLPCGITTQVMTNPSHFAPWIMWHAGRAARPRA